MSHTKMAADDNRDLATGATVYVCVTCRTRCDAQVTGEAGDGPRPGSLLADATERAAQGTGVTVSRVECLGNCSRSLSAAMRSDGTWTYIFGTLEADKDAAALIEGARLLAKADDGILPWRERPDALKRGLIARVPPLDFTTPMDENEMDENEMEDTEMEDTE